MQIQLLLWWYKTKPVFWCSSFLPILIKHSILNECQPTTLNVIANICDNMEKYCTKSNMIHKANTMLQTLYYYPLPKVHFLFWQALCFRSKLSSIFPCIFQTTNLRKGHKYHYLCSPEGLFCGFTASICYTKIHFHRRCLKIRILRLKYWGQATSQKQDVSALHLTLFDSSNVFLINNFIPCIVYCELFCSNMKQMRFIHSRIKGLYLWMVGLRPWHHFTMPVCSDSWHLPLVLCRCGYIRHVLWRFNPS